MVNQIDWMTLVDQTDHPKSVRTYCVINCFVVPLCYWLTIVCRLVMFVIRLNLSSLFSVKYTSMFPQTYSHDFTVLSYCPDILMNLIEKTNTFAIKITNIFNHLHVELKGVRYPVLKNKGFDCFRVRLNRNSIEHFLPLIPVILFEYEKLICLEDLGELF